MVARAAVVAFGLALTTGGGASAQPVDDFRAYTVGEIGVDVEAANAVEARAQAIELGKRRGLDALLRKLVARSNWDRLPTVDDLAIDRFVQAFEVSRERLSATRYVADLQVAYLPDAVLDLMRASGLPITLEAAPPVVVAPLLRLGAASVLWREDNPWRDAWLEHVDPFALVEVYAPLGDLIDVAALGAQDAVDLHSPGMEALALRYDAGATVVVEATPSGGSDGFGDLYGFAPEVGAPPPALDVRARASGPYEELAFEERLRGGAGQTAADLMPVAIERVIEALAELWKEERAVREDRLSTLVVEAPLSGLASWTGLRSRLAQIPELRAQETTEFSQTHAVLMLSYVGDIERLVDSMAARSIALRDFGSGWEIEVEQERPAFESQPSVNGPDGATSEPAATAEP